MAASHALPRSLEDVSTALELDIQKDMEGKRTMLKLSKPRRPSKTNPSTWHEKQEDYNILYEYCKQDVEVERLIYKTLRPLNKKEQEIWFLDQKINMRGVQIDVHGAEDALFMIEKYKNECEKEVTILTDSYLHNVNQINRTKDWIKSQGVDMPNMTKSTVSHIIANCKLPDNVRRLLEIRQQLSKTSTKKYQALNIATDINGRLRDLLLYHAASTGRWGGRMFQPQNLPRGNVQNIEECIRALGTHDIHKFKNLYPDVMGAISSCIRGMIVAKEGHDLIVADYSSIESRIVLWLANDEAGLEKYRNKVDLYVDMAMRIYKKNNISEKERHLGKTTILGCAYGMGHKKFRETCKNQGLEITEETAQLAIWAYRQTYKLVRQMWFNQEKAAIKAVRSKKLISCSKVYWGVVGDFLYCKLPSKRCLAYYRPEVVEVEKFNEAREELTYLGTNSITRKYERQSTWGGKLVENITQAVARDVLAEAMIRCEKTGYKIVLSVHDELIAEVPSDFGSLEEFIDLMTTLPLWAEGCLIEAEGWRGKRYRK
jgi:DNA polymerase|tara:strand:+ start:151 stop:1779 length:1629 start_codon:yes stop_codon:yes gene_type:complete